MVKDKSIMTYQCNLDDISGKPVIFLTEEEYEKVKKCWIPDERKVLKTVRDLFLFQCNTGLRYSDVFNLRRNNIADDAIEIVAKKTSKSTKVYLNATSRKILEKYKDFPFKDNKALPVMSNQKMNKYLQELCWRAGINTKITISYMVGEQIKHETFEKWKLIGSHCGRRTFVSLALASGATPEEIMYVTGHSCYNAMKPYIGQADEQRKHATSVLDGRDEKAKMMKILGTMSADELKQLLKKA